MTAITRRLEFDAGHRLINHESKCKHLHGHRYCAEITVQADALDRIGRVIDFGVVKALVGKWIDDNWDHNMVINPNDPILKFAGLLEKHPYLCYQGGEPANPTAEVMARILFGVAVELLPSELKVVKVRLYETPNCFAEYPDV